MDHYPSYDIGQFIGLPEAVRQRILDQYVEFAANQYLFNNLYIDQHSYQPTTDLPPNRFGLDKEWVTGVTSNFNYHEHLQAHIDQCAREHLVGDT